MQPLALPHIGNTDLLQLTKVGFLAPSHISSLSILPTMKWASEMACRDDVAVVGGFSSRMEEEVLRLLLQRRCGIILLLARQLYKSLPEVWQQPLADNRLLIISTSRQTRQSRQAAFERNMKVCELADQVVMPTAPPKESSLYTIYEQLSRAKRLTTLL